NETLCFRAKGLTDRQLRRHLEALEAAGLICRRDSANGKRFPVMQHGKAIGAFGLDLSPLFAQGNELLAMALRHREEAEELRGLRAQILRLRAACADLVLDEPLAAFVAGLRNLVRRSTLTLLEARAALARLAAVFADTNRPVAQDLEHPPIASKAPIEAVEPLHKPFVRAAEITTQTDKTPASDGQNVRHKEQESQTKKRKTPTQSPPDWCELTELSDFFPKPDSPRMAAAIAFEFGKMLRIDQSTLVEAVNKLGLGELLKLEDRIATQIDKIHNPDAYLRSLLRS
ncbi:replication protein C, partial [Thioclava sp. BHET1]